MNPNKNGGDRKRFLTGEDGPLIVEHAIVMAVVVLVCIATFSFLGQQANIAFETIGKALGGQ